MLWSKIAGPVQKALLNTKNCQVLKYNSSYVEVKYLGKHYKIKVEKL
jgi:hypothetical protein